MRIRVIGQAALASSSVMECRVAALLARVCDRIQPRPARQFTIMFAAANQPILRQRPSRGNHAVFCAAGLPPFRITRIAAAPLFGESPKGGWSAEIRPEDLIHAIIAVHTDQGLTGYGSVFTDGRLVQAGAEGARAALSRRGRADAGARERKAASEHVLDGTRRNADPYDQRHRHRAVGHSWSGDGLECRPFARRWVAHTRAALLLAADGRAQGDV